MGDLEGFLDRVDGVEGLNLVIKAVRLRKGKLLAEMGRVLFSSDGESSSGTGEQHVCVACYILRITQ